ncbi:hypothetical protein J0V14_002228 [Vibrio parahaemolyticus]|nr:hypothetical protein [Vibrio parahaemolyticus]QFQ79270.1 hypothetical protein F9277_09080 [Vibrio harveyi]
MKTSCWMLTLFIVIQVD